jgi:hypothetical protein
MQMRAARPMACPLGLDKAQHAGAQPNAQIMGLDYPLSRYITFQY